MNRLALTLLSALLLATAAVAQDPRKAEKAGEWLAVEFSESPGEGVSYQIATFGEQILLLTWKGADRRDKPAPKRLWRLRDGKATPVVGDDGKPLPEADYCLDEDIRNDLPFAVVIVPQKPGQHVLLVHKGQALRVLDTNGNACENTFGDWLDAGGKILFKSNIDGCELFVPQGGKLTPTGIKDAMFVEYLGPGPKDGQVLIDVQPGSGPNVQYLLEGSRVTEYRMPPPPANWTNGAPDLWREAPHEGGRLVVARDAKSKTSRAWLAKDGKAQWITHSGEVLQHDWLSLQPVDARSGDAGGASWLVANTGKKGRLFSVTGTEAKAVEGVESQSGALVFYPVGGHYLIRSDERDATFVWRLLRGRWAKIAQPDGKPVTTPFLFEAQVCGGVLFGRYFLDPGKTGWGRVDDLTIRAVEGEHRVDTWRGAGREVYGLTDSDKDMTRRVLRLVGDKLEPVGLPGGREARNNRVAIAAEGKLLYLSTHDYAGKDSCLYFRKAE